MPNSRNWKFESVDEIGGAGALSAVDRAWVGEMLRAVNAGTAPAAFHPKGAPLDAISAVAIKAAAGEGAAAAAGAKPKAPPAKRAKKEAQEPAAATAASAAAAVGAGGDDEYGGGAAAAAGAGDDEYGGGGGGGVSAAAAPAPAAPAPASAAAKKEKEVVGEGVFAAGQPIIKGGAFCFTNVRDAQAEAAISAAGGTVVLTVTKKTTAVITADASSLMTGKISDAQAKGIPIYKVATLRAALGL